MAILVNRTYTLRTTRLLAEYLAAHYPTAKRISEFRLGGLDPGIIQRLGHGVSANLAGITRGYVDSLVVTADAVQLWEAKNRLTDAAIGQIEGYLADFPNTPEARPYVGMPLSGHILVAYDDPTVAARAAAKGLYVVVYRPSWYESDLMNSEHLSNQRRHAALIAASDRGNP